MPPSGQARRRGERDGCPKGEKSGTFLLTKNMQILFFWDELPSLCRSHPVSSSQFGTYPGHSLVSHRSHVAREEG